MLLLRVFGSSEGLAPIGDQLEQTGEVGHVVISSAVRPGHAQLTATLEVAAADRVLRMIASRGIADDDVSLSRVDEIAPLAERGGDPSMIWADVIGRAHRNARPVARFLVFMIAAGVIAGFGVIEVNGILIVGAMAVSPDFLPINATCVGLVSGQLRLAALAATTLAAGLFATCAAALVLTAGLDLFGLLPSGFVIGESALSGLTTVDSATIGVAVAAGVAGTLALETRAGAAVGVAISVTTIPAAAYLGVAAAQGEAEKVLGALAVLGVNVAILIATGSLTLLVQRQLAARPAVDIT